MRNQLTQKGSFPRQISRGPIEAEASRMVSFDVSTFRDRSVAAPLKPVVLARCHNGRWGFPRQISRGPIEAFVNAGRLFSMFPFRDRSVAAPLKHFQNAVLHLAISAFRDRSVAAPLKASLPKRKSQET
jgi:hypothetical protein